MIEDKKLGLKISENPEDEEKCFWERCEKKAEDAIKNCEREIIINNKLIELSKEQQKK